jgi:hypothetical protein
MYAYEVFREGWLFVMLLNENKIQGIGYFTFLDLDWFLTGPFSSLCSVQPASLFVYWSESKYQVSFCKDLISP